MRVAIVHDYIKEYGGAERVLENLYRLFPDATIFTLVYLPKYLGPHRVRFAKFRIQTSFLQAFPYKEKLISMFRIVSPLFFKQFDFSGYDIIIVSQTGAYFPNTVNKSGKLLICYTHTPPRYLYGYKTAREWKNNPFFLVLGQLANHFLRLVDYYASRNVDYFIANSNEVASRIRKFYRRDAIVIYPPVHIESLKIERILSERSKNKKSVYYLTGGRLARAKGIDIVIAAFNQLGLPLTVFGKGFAGFDHELRKLAGHTIEFVGEVDEAEKFRLMAGAEAYVFASFDEDFGITPVEALSAGTPVIAYKSGGVKESVIDGETGILYQNNSVDSLVEAIQKFQRTRFSAKNCINRSKQFSGERFEKEMLSFIQTIRR